MSRREKRSELPEKDLNWLAPKDVGERLNISGAFIERIFNDFCYINDRSGYMCDANTVWRIEKMRTEKSSAFCLHISEIERFAKCYQLDNQKTPDWLSLEEVARHFSKQTGCIIKHLMLYRIYHDLERHNGHDKVTNTQWTIGKMRVRNKMVHCIHASELERFGAQYHLDASPKQEGWLSSKDIAERLKRNWDSYRFERILKRLQPTADLSIMHDPVKNTHWPVQIFNVNGKPKVCLLANALTAFADCYRAFKCDEAPETPEWLSAQDLADYLGTANVQPIETLLDSFKPIRNDVSTAGTTEYMCDEIKQSIWRIQDFFKDGVLHRHLHESQIESFINQYRLHRKLATKQEHKPRPVELWYE